jgi:Amt family ammonium transporter
MLAGAAGGMSAMVYVWSKWGKPDPSMLANGTLAGLVAITAPCAFVTAPVAVLIGLLAGLFVSVAVGVVERTFKLDDPVGAISVHGVNGLFGLLCVGLFADGTYGGGTNSVAANVTGLFYGNPKQLAAQVIGICANILWVGGSTFVAWKITGLITKGHRVSAEIELKGLDHDEMGVPAYIHDDGITANVSTPAKVAG